MAAHQALWADILRDLATAESHVGTACDRARSLREAAALPDDVRIDREYMIGTMLHHAYSGIESALERLIRAVDGDLPNASSTFHADLIRRAATPIDGLRPAIIAKETAEDLHRLRRFRHAFRHIYEGYEYARAAENVAVAERSLPRFTAEVTAFARSIGMVDDPGGDAVTAAPPPDGR